MAIIAIRQEEPKRDCAICWNLRRDMATSARLLKEVDETERSLRVGHDLVFLYALNMQLNCKQSL